MFSSLSAGILLGLSAGFSPGPLLMLVISQTLRHGIREGAKVACAPLVTDLPIIIASLAVVSSLSSFRPIIACMSLAGALVVGSLAWETFRSPGIETVPDSAAPSSLRRGALVNLLSPHPWLFWLTVGGPFVLKGAAAGPLGGILFAGGFLACLVGAKIIVALAAGKSRRFLDGSVYRWSMRFLGTILLFYVLLLIRDGLKLLDMLSM